MPIRPQAGPQEAFFSSPADILIFGGGAGGGKTWAICVEPLRHIDVKDFSAVIFRRNMTQVTNPGGLWDEARNVYGIIPKAYSVKNPHRWIFASGNVVQFAHLALEDTVHDWQGSQVPLILFDELTHFTRYQFFYMISRNRSTCGVAPYIRATCNPDADSWVREFLDWWIDKETGFPIPERIGVIRYFVRVQDNLVWGDTREELVAYLPDPDEIPEGVTVEDMIKSVTFIPSKVSDNKVLLAKDPSYYGNLLSLPLVERERLLEGNWNVRPAAGAYFRRAWVEVIDVMPADVVDTVRYWDLAATEKTEKNDPDYTVGIKMAKTDKGEYIVMHCHSQRTTPKKVKDSVHNFATQDGESVRVGGPIDPGGAGKFVSQDFVTFLDGYDVQMTREAQSREKMTETERKTGKGAKIRRFAPFSSQAEAGNVKVLRGDWNEEFFGWLEAFPEALHDDHADATAGAYRMLAEGFSGSAMIAHMRNQLRARGEPEPLVQLPEKQDPLPWRQSPAPEPVDSSAKDAYEHALQQFGQAPQVCKRCGQSVIGERVTDGIHVWHFACK